jgi:hypothetical protein
LFNVFYVTTYNNSYNSRHKFSVVAGPWFLKVDWWKMKKIVINHECILNMVGKGLPSDFAERQHSETNFHILCGHEDHVGWWVGLTTSTKHRCISLSRHIQRHCVALLNPKHQHSHMKLWRSTRQEVHGCAALHAYTSILVMLVCIANWYLYDPISFDGKYLVS